MFDFCQRCEKITRKITRGCLREDVKRAYLSVDRCPKYLTADIIFIVLAVEGKQVVISLRGGYNASSKAIENDYLFKEDSKTSHRRKILYMTGDDNVKGVYPK